MVVEILEFGFLVSLPCRHPELVSGYNVMVVRIAQDAEINQHDVYFAFLQFH